jgi:hypothetical protein
MSAQSAFRFFRHGLIGRVQPTVWHL